MADTSYIKNGNVADNARLFKEMAVYLFNENEAVGTLSDTWTPPSGKQPFGYLSEDGLEISREDGDNNEFKGHNGDNVLVSKSGGYLTIKATGLEAKREVVEAYFNADIEDNHVYVDPDKQEKRRQLLVVGLDQLNRLIFMHAPSVTVNEIESFNLKNGELSSFGMTFRTYSHTGVGGRKYHADFFNIFVDNTPTVTPHHDN